MKNGTLRSGSEIALSSVTDDKKTKHGVSLLTFTLSKSEMSQIRPVLPRLMYFEDALLQTGWGLYYKFLVGFSMASLFTNGFALLCIHFALPLSACDTVLGQKDVVHIFVCFSVGKAVGGFLLCTISDNTGKRCMISKSLIIIFGSCFVSAFSHNEYTLYLAAFFLGSGLEANMVAIKIYLAEILPASRRGLYTVLPDLFWTAGYLSSAAFIHFFGTNNTNLSEHQGMDMRLTTWRIIFAIGGGLCITMGCTSALLEMSPRFLLFKRRVITASLVLKQFYAINKSRYSETFEIHSQQLVDLISDFNINIDPEPVGIIQQVIVLVKVTIRMLRVLLRRPFLKVALMVTLIKLPTLFGISGSTIYLSQLLHTGNDSLKGSNFIHLGLNFDKNCTVSLEETQSEYFLLISMNALLAQIILMCVIDRIGRRLPIFAGLCIYSVTSVMLAFGRDFVLLAVSASLFIFGLTLVESTLYVVVIESFPTAIRATAMSATSFYGYVSSCFLYSLLDTTRQNFLTVFASIALGTSLLACFIPEMKRRPMRE